MTTPINSFAPPSNNGPPGNPSSNNAASNNTVLGLSKLPRELRDKIWDLTLPQQRVVNVTYNANKDAYTTPAHAPISLHICQESRERALKRYTLSFGTKEGEARIYFNFEDDVLYMDMDRAEPTTITEQGALCRAVHHFVTKTEDIKKVKFFSCDEMAVKWMAILRGGKFFNLTSLKMFVTMRQSEFYPMPHFPRDLVDPVVRICTIVPSESVRHRMARAMISCTETMFGIIIRYGLVEERDEDEDGLDLSVYLVK